MPTCPHDNCDTFDSDDGTTRCICFDCLKVLWRTETPPDQYPTPQLVLCSEEDA